MLFSEQLLMRLVAHPVTHENVYACVMIWTWTWTSTIHSSDQVQVDVHDHAQDQAWQNLDPRKER
jgi:hypothetical protein